MSREPLEARDGVGADLRQIASARKGDAPFNKPWELRVFALAVAACEAGKFQWSSFQEALTSAIKNDEPDQFSGDEDRPSYYEHFLTALEVVLARSEVLDGQQVQARARSILETPPHRHHVARYEPVTVDPGRIR